MDNSNQQAPQPKAKRRFFPWRKRTASPRPDAPTANNETSPQKDDQYRKRENNIVTQTFERPAAQITTADPVSQEKQTTTQSVKDFNSFNFHPSITAAINAMGYTAPTPIQEQAIPVILQGKDVIGLAQTGTGKTAAFVLPILHRLATNTGKGTRALVISPTRELAEQTSEVFNKLGKRAGLNAVPVYGGTGMEEQIYNLRHNPAIVVACPGRLLDHLWKGTIELSHLETLVIDEADRMFDMGFLPDIRSIMKCIMNKRQTLLFSATMPEGIRRLVKEFLTNPVTIQIGKTMPAQTVSHALYPVEQHLKSALLKALLRKIDADSILVFTRTKRRTERVAEMLINDGHRVSYLQGDLTQNRRQAAIDGFRSGRIKILVATDIASRGIDILRISHVINYDMPESPEDYIHRIGRTGRVEKSGQALTLVTREDTRKINELEKLLKKPIERVTLEGFNYDQPAHDHTPKPRRQTRRSTTPRRPNYRETKRR